jgi:hypothetical protein
MPTGVYPRTKEYLKKLKKQGFQKGNKPWNFEKTQYNNKILKKIADNKRGKHHSPNTEFKKGHKPIGSFKPGEDHWNWNGGISSTRHRLTNSFRWKQWRTQIFERDNYTCQECEQRGGKLHPHHIHPFEFAEILNYLKETLGTNCLYEEAIDCKFLWNPCIGKTLCVDCHKKTNNYNKTKT